MTLISETTALKAAILASYIKQKCHKFRNLYIVTECKIIITYVIVLNVLFAVV